jgi:TalC/MipB family fructose-6-phosphate aldolase
VTTNPSLVKAEGNVDFHERVLEICQTVDGDVSAEVTATEFDGMMEEAHTLAQIHDNVVVKIPLIKDGIKALRALDEEGIKTNCTLCFSPTQALLAAKAGADYISPFIGRIDDISSDGMGLIEEIVQIYDNYGFETEILAASIRHPRGDDAVLGVDEPAGAPAHGPRAGALPGGLGGLQRGPGRGPRDHDGVRPPARLRRPADTLTAALPGASAGPAAYQKKA